MALEDSLSCSDEEPPPNLFLRNVNKVLKERYPIHLTEEGISALSEIYRRGNPHETARIIFKAYKKRIFPEEYFLTA